MSLICASARVELLGKLWVEGDTLKWAMKTGEIRQLDLTELQEDREWKKITDIVKDEGRWFRVL